MGVGCKQLNRAAWQRTREGEGENYAEEGEIMPCTWSGKQTSTITLAALDIAAFLWMAKQLLVSACLCWSLTGPMWVLLPQVLIEKRNKMGF